MTLSYQKRICDAPIVRFLPEDSFAQTENILLESRAIREFPSQTLLTIHRVSEELGVSVEDLILAGYATLLFRLTRQDTFTIAIGSSHIATMNLEGECTFRELLIKAVPRAMRQSGSSTSSAQVSRQSLEKHPEDCIQFVFRPLATENSSTGSDGELKVPSPALRLIVSNDAQTLELESPSALWHQRTLASWVGYLIFIVEAAVTDIDVPISKLPMWNEDHARRFLENWNSTAVEFPGETTVVGRFAVQARRRPDAIAVIAGECRYTYRELDDRSTELARHLVLAGSAPNRAVVVCMERTVDLLVSLLAVLKSGGCYVPLDPLIPAMRLQGIVDECNPVIILTDVKTAELLKRSFRSADHTAPSIPTFCVDTNWPVRHLQADLPIQIDPNSLAYTIYTSGTTGKPKGVRIVHSALLNLICSFWREPGIGENDRTLAVAPISFDIATMDMFLPICSGGTLVIANRKDSVDPYSLARFVAKQDITWLQATPATWRMLVTSGWKGKRNLKMISGGEALTRELANDLLLLGGELWNAYGPTETTIYSGLGRIEPGKGIVPVGPPISNTSFYVVDRSGFPVPPGVPGELCIGGIGVSPGYVDRPELTAEKFVADPFAGGTSNKIFRTGDLVRITGDNLLEFFGRMDHQVKLRGYRIELGEIEAVLRNHSSVTDAVVVLREDIPGEPRLVAYVIGSEKEVNAKSLKEHAAEFLPEYMLPSLIVTMEKFPLTESGKINRRALPIPEQIPGQIVAEKPQAAAANDELETKLLAIFRDVLRNNSIGVTDSFFRFGGYSLLTVRLFSRIDRELHVRLPISLLFDAPTVRDLAQVIRKGITPSVIVPIRPYGRSAPLFVIQSYLLYSAMLEIVEPDRPVYGVREMGDKREPLSLEERARKSAQEIVAVCPSGPVFLAGWCAAGTLTVEIARELRNSGREVGLVALFDAERPGFTMPRGLSGALSRLWRKTTFHTSRVRHLTNRERLNYVSEAIKRNFDAVVESLVSSHYQAMLWLQSRLGMTISEGAFHDLYEMTALKKFSAKPYPGKLNLFRAADVPNLPDVDATLGWSTVAQGGVEVNFVPGDHVSMFKKPHVDSLARRIQSELQKFESGNAWS